MFLSKLLLKGIQIGRFNPHGRAGISVTMMLGQMKNSAILRDLHVERQMRPQSDAPNPV